MSVLSSTNHTPQRVYSLLRLLQAQDGRLSVASVRAWMKPGAGEADADSNIVQLIGAASSLQFIESKDNQCRLTSATPASMADFADDVHDRLVRLDFEAVDSILLEAFAAMIVLCERHQGTTWLDDMTANDKAEAINSAVGGAGAGADDSEDKRRFNKTKFPAWKRWMTFLGLGLERSKVDFYPYPAQRVERELERAIAADAKARELDIDTFVELVAGRMPYLDRGRLFESSVAATRLPPLGRQVSRVLSGVLRDLHDDGRIVLKSIGDARETFALAVEPHPIKNIKAVNLKGLAANA